MRVLLLFSCISSMLLLFFLSLARHSSNSPSDDVRHTQKWSAGVRTVQDPTRTKLLCMFYVAGTGFMWRKTCVLWYYSGGFQIAEFSCCEVTENYGRRCTYPNLAAGRTPQYRWRSRWSLDHACSPHSRGGELRPTGLAAQSGGLWADRRLRCTAALRGPADWIHLQQEKLLSGRLFASAVAQNTGECANRRSFHLEIRLEMRFLNGTHSTDE
jgi:hypothetical protein